jgi:hypothetical protein
MRANQAAHTQGFRLGAAAAAAVLLSYHQLAVQWNFWAHEDNIHVHTYIHTYVHTYMHTFIHTYNIHTCMQQCVGP